MKYILIDLDGTICKKYPNRDTYDHTLAHLDTPITPVIRVLEALCNHDDVFPIFITARNGNSRNVTGKWILNNTNLICDRVMLNFKNKVMDSYEAEMIYNLYMNENNNPSDVEAKKELLYQFLKDYNTTKESILGVFDDNPEVNKMWREEGLFVFDVNQGD